MEKQNAADKARLYLESLRARMLMRFGEKGTRIILISFATALILTVLLLAAILLIRINEIKINGDVTAFNEAEIIEAAEIDIGDGLLWKSSYRIKENLKKNLPVAFDVRVFKSPFGKVWISLELIDVEYYTKMGDTYYAFNSDMRVLDADKSRSKYTAMGAVRVDLPETRELKVGERIVFYDTVEETDTEGKLLYEVRDESVYSYVGDFLRSLKENQLHAGADAVILTRKFDITLIYAGQFHISFGDSSSLDVKCSVLNKMLMKIEENKKNGVQTIGKARIDLSDITRPSLREDYTLDFSEYEN